MCDAGFLGVIFVKAAQKAGIYVHVPFCRSKCRYCDFYSLTGYDDALLGKYAGRVCGELAAWREDTGEADTFYFGGGTPPLLGAGRMADIIERAAQLYGLSGAEISTEANPGGVNGGFLRDIASAGINRISFGVQSSAAGELAALGRTHTPHQAAEAVDLARRAGIDNISVDIMLGIMGQDEKSALATAKFAADLGVQHISAYMLKVEEGTPLYRERSRLDIPNSDEVSDIYLSVCGYLEVRGYMQYEISNFALPGYECRHNLKYWTLAPYLGIGPAAHSMLNGRRFYYKRDLTAFFSGGERDVLYEGEAGGAEEYVMLHLRLSSGLDTAETAERYGGALAENIRERADKLAGEGYLRREGETVRLTRRGFLLSNAVIAYLLYN